MTCINCECDDCKKMNLLKNGHKKCTKCGEIKNINEFQTNGIKNKKGEIIKKSNCKDCRKIINKQYYQKRKDKNINPQN